MRHWYLEGIEEELANLVLRADRIMFGRTILAERVDGGGVILNAFHWPESNDAEAVSVVEAVPWDSLMLVFHGQGMDSLTYCRCYSIPDHGYVIAHKTLGLGIVQGIWGSYTRCILSGRERNFVTKDFEDSDRVVRLRYAYEETG